MFGKLMSQLIYNTISQACVQKFLPSDILFPDNKTSKRIAFLISHPAKTKNKNKKTVNHQTYRYFSLIHILYVLA